MRLIFSVINSGEMCVGNVDAITKPVTVPVINPTSPE